MHTFSIKIDMHVIDLEIACYDLEKSYSKSFNLSSQKISGENNKNVKSYDVYNRDGKFTIYLYE